MATKVVLERQTLENRFRSARANLLFVIAATVINIILLISDGDSYFLFSASVPYLLVSYGMTLCGMFPAEVYGDDYANMLFFDKSVFGVFLILAIIVLALYLVCWIFSKKNRIGWMIFALVLFSIDTVMLVLFYGIDLEGILDIIVHILVLGYLIMGVSAAVKLKKLPEQEACQIEEGEQASESSGAWVNSEIIRIADPDVKARILLESDALGHTITYRRVKRVNELVIDGNVYAEFTALVETPHCLTANFGGHLIEAGLDNGSSSYLKVDGEVVEKKLRLI